MANETRKILDIMAFRMEGGKYAGSSIFIFDVSAVTTMPAAGDTYTNNSSTFTIRNVHSRSTGANYIGHLYGERTAGSNDPNASGTLTRATGSGDASISYNQYDTGWSWDEDVVEDLGASDGMPYIEKSVKTANSIATDESIDNVAFPDLPVQTGLMGSFDNIGGIVKYAAFMDKLLYWMLGYEDGGTSPVNLGGGYYEHLFELDKHERHFTAYRTAEQTAGDYNANDRKNRAATIAFKKGLNDHRYRHVVCTGFRFYGDATDGFIRWSAKGVSRQEARGNYNSSQWTFASDATDSGQDALFRHLTVSLKTQAGSYSTLAIKSFEVNVEIPQSTDKDSESGLYIAEPVFTGKYEITANILLNRHQADTYLAIRDAFTALQSLKLVAASGSYTFEIYIPEAYIIDTFPTEDEVANQPIELRTGPVDADTANIFATEIDSSVLIQKGNLFVITNNQNSTNEMRRE